MAAIDDLAMMKILNELDLRERTKMRLVSRRFRNLVDQILPKRLVIFERNSPVAGVLPFINEPYSLKECVSVDSNLNKFFNSEAISHQLRLIQQLVIVGYQHQSEISLPHSFTQLKYLNVSDVGFKNSEILRSFELKHLIVNNNAFKTEEEFMEVRNQMNDYHSAVASSFTIFRYDFWNLATCNLKVLSIGRVAVEHSFFMFCVMNRLFKSLEHLDVNLVELKTLSYLNKECPSLKRIDCLVQRSLDRFFYETNIFDLRRFAREIRKDLSIYLYGIKLTPRTSRFIPKLLKRIELSIDIEQHYPNMISCSLDESTYRMLTASGKRIDISGFYERIRSLVTLYSFELWNPVFFQKLKKLEKIVIVLFDPPTQNFNDIYQVFGSIGEFHLYARKEISCSNIIIDPLGKSPHNQIHNLVLRIWSDINFDFLFQMHRLKTVKLHLFYPVPLTTILKFIMNAKYLDCLEVCFARSKIHTLGMLKRFKDLVISNVKSPMNIRTIIHTKKDVSFVRLALYHEDLDPAAVTEEVESIFDALQYNNRRLAPQILPYLLE